MKKSILFIIFCMVFAIFVSVSPARNVGLLAEEVDTETGELIGNFPQAFSHIGLINANPRSPG